MCIFTWIFVYCMYIGENVCDMHWYTWSIHVMCIYMLSLWHFSRWYLVWVLTLKFTFNITFKFYKVCIIILSRSLQKIHPHPQKTKKNTFKWKIKWISNKNILKMELLGDVPFFHYKGLSCNFVGYWVVIEQEIKVTWVTCCQFFGLKVSILIVS